MDLNLAQRIAVWLTMTPEWASPTMTHRLNEEFGQLMQATPDVVDRYLQAANHAIAQVEHGEHP